MKILVTIMLYVDKCYIAEANFRPYIAQPMWSLDCKHGIKLYEFKNAYKFEIVKYKYRIMS